MPKNDGGSAFPAGPDPRGDMHSGMSLRDYFASAASEKDVQKWMSEGIEGWAGIGRTREQAKWAYADAMLKAREEAPDE